jgi:feruloyl esterase
MEYMKAGLSALFATMILTMPSMRAEAQKSCESLISFAFPHATITSASLHPGGRYDPIDGWVKTFTDLPPSCQVTANMKPTEEADIMVQVWLPTQRYSRRFLGTGNGGFGGNIFDSELARGINNGFATANTNLGTCDGCSLNDKNNQLVGHSEKWRDFGWLSTHMMTQFSKALIEEFYGAPASYSYFAGCSTGGQQALMEATRFPDDYDGVLAGAPAFNRTHLHTLLIAQYRATHPPSTASALMSLRTESLPPEANGRGLPFARAIRELEQRAQSFQIQSFEIQRAQQTPADQLRIKLDAVNEAVLKTCLGRKGEPKTDTFLTDPRDCKFEPATLQCSGNDGPHCLTPDQVAAMEVYYKGAVNPNNGAIIHPGNVPGSETSTIGAVGFAYNLYSAEPAFDSLFKWVFGAKWDWRTFDFDHHVETVDTVLAGDLNANNTDLKRFQDHRGKLILYSGWADPLIPSRTTINYYNAITQTMFGSLSPEDLRKTQDFARLFMAPGMWHCGITIGAGPGPNAFGGVMQQPPPSFDPQHDLLNALTAWVEDGAAAAPTSVIATKYNDDDPQHGIAMQRPICLFPAVPRYDGTGRPEDPQSFSCVVTHPPDYNNEKPAPAYGP